MRSSSVIKRGRQRRALAGQYDPQAVGDLRDDVVDRPVSIDRRRHAEEHEGRDDLCKRGRVL